MIPTLEERAKGCLLGLACGDAVGTTLEFYPRERILRPLTDMIGGGKFRVAKGQWTDDTSMALCLAESLLCCNGFDPIDQLELYWLWASTGYNSSKDKPFGLGQQVSRALFEFKRTGQPYSTLTASKFSGNGSLMRIAPIPLFYLKSVDDVLHYAKLSSRTTHPSNECVQSCQLFSILLVNALNGIKKENLLDCPKIEQFDCLERVLSKQFETKNAEQISSSGFVIDTLEAALWAFWQTDNFREAILAAANLGGDADTIAAICGQLAGAYYGINAIPQDWLDCLYRKDDIENLACRLILQSVNKF